MCQTNEVLKKISLSLILPEAAMKCVALWCLKTWSFKKWGALKDRANNIKPQKPKYIKRWSLKIAFLRN